eukprot:680154-Pelagomonas_calceolata.AAC.1
MATLKVKLLQAKADQRDEEKRASSVNIAARPQQQQQRQQQQPQQQGMRGRGSRSGGRGGRSGQQQGGGVVPGTDGRTLANKQCYGCKRWGHYQDHCPSMQ